MKQRKGLNDNLKPEYKKTTNKTTMDPTTVIDSRAPTIWNRGDSRHSVCGLTYRHAIKEGKKAINHNWVNNIFCFCLPHFH